MFSLSGRFSSFLKLSSFKPNLFLQVRHDSSLDKFYRPRKTHYPPPKPRDKTARYDGFLKAKRKRLRRNKTP
ncbi:unnamed protein product [Rhizophagus irregularis]|uniref:Uncharacterized protein n=1 Tax=Rhizophagus irregularis TaxID=588596 RepID=A0A915ZHW2_9GLOM|nr:hypothetical protein OCT59_001909 [Rhizophagus irregularis]GBC47561.1 hypothetical protein RIR_jg38255.t1 [Rhizophagus irregularis DAOM 181602=DAOM 197198]CAB4401105.1 unnamed protein product [Rhizophagus irregularis]CAB4408281.1 unnamed protein product [Rhizophagus irregularis]CAB4481705.1 unnamed protein product [Rhizophagus irregularis]